jgi:hypothetical protein
LIGTVLSDLLWAYAIMFTSPLIVSLGIVRSRRSRFAHASASGISLSVPLAMMSDALLHHSTFSPLYLLGLGLVLVGFFIANVHDKLGMVAPFPENTALADKEYYSAARFRPFCSPAVGFWMLGPTPPQAVSSAAGAYAPARSLDDLEPEVEVTQDVRLQLPDESAPAHEDGDLDAQLPEG